MEDRSLITSEDGTGGRLLSGSPVIDGSEKLDVLSDLSLEFIVSFR